MDSSRSRRLHLSAIGAIVVLAALSNEERVKKLVRGFSLCLALSLLAASTGLAAPVPCPTSGTGSGGAPSFSDLIATNAGGGCFITDKVFSAFTFLGTFSGTATPLGATQVSYSMDTIAPTLIGFEFAMSLNASGSSSNDIKLSYNINQAAGLADITSVHLFLTGQASSGGSISVTENYCLGAFFNTGCASSGVLNTNAGTPHQDVFFSGVSQLSIVKDINAAGNGPNGLASISGVRNAVDETVTTLAPEPATVSSYLLGLLALGWFRRKSTKS
jgi:hypothetical protein